MLLDTILNVNEIVDYHSKNNFILEKIRHLEKEVLSLTEKMALCAPTNPRRPSTQFKEIKKEFLLIQKELKITNRDIKKFAAIRNAATKIGKQHGNVILHGIRFYW